ncbi:MAG: class I SAM-dependent methyltransferase [Terriglobales bacterium]
MVTSNSWLKPLLKAVSNARCRAWDLIHGVDTCGDIPLVTLDFQNKNKTAGLEYQSHHPRIIRAGLMSLKILYQDYTFVDFGCGKGRVLLVASEFPFRRIIGLEFAPQLAETARGNLKSYRATNRKCFEIEAITADAIEYELAHEPQVLYFYSPFARGVMDQIVQNIENSFQKSPRDLLVLFSGVLNMRDSAFGSRPQYERLLRGRYVDVYRHRSS